MFLEGKIGLYKRKIRRLFQIASLVLKEDFSYVNVSLNFVDGGTIKDLNKRFRNIDNVTDVLSFPNLNKLPMQSLSEFDGEKNVDDGLLFLGDIIICKEVAKKQAKEYGHSLKREVCFLALHGLLHLLGYDHIEQDDEKLMQSTAKQILDKAGINR